MYPPRYSSTTVHDTGLFVISQTAKMKAKYSATYPKLLLTIIKCILRKLL